MDDLLAFVRGALDARMTQLDEDERVALAAHANAWNAEATRHDGEVVIVPDHTPSGVGVVFGTKNADHIARWDPDRVLEEVRLGRAEVEAKRRIFAHIGMVVISPGREALPPEYVEQMERFARTFAQPYAGRPGWREEWAL